MHHPSKPSMGLYALILIFLFAINMALASPTSKITNIARSVENSNTDLFAEAPFPPNTGGQGTTTEAQIDPVWINLEKDRWLYACKPNPGAHMCTFSLVQKDSWHGGTAVDVYDPECKWIANRAPNRDELKGVALFNTIWDKQVLAVHMDGDYPHRGLGISNGFTMTWQGRVSNFIDTPFGDFRAEGTFSAQTPGDVWWAIRAPFPC